jgi:hypothetical protein
MKALLNAVLDFHVSQKSEEFLDWILFYYFFEEFRGIFNLSTGWLVNIQLLWLNFRLYCKSYVCMAFQFISQEKESQPAE